MTCRDAIDRLVEDLDSELAPTTLAEFEAHLAMCAPCRAYLATYRGTRELVRRLNAVELPASLQARLRHLLDGRQQAVGGDSDGRAVQVVEP